MKYEITFTHTVEQKYKAIVDADDKESAREIFNEDQFRYVEGNGEPIDQQGLEINIDSIEEVSE